MNFYFGICETRFGPTFIAAVDKTPVFVGFMSDRDANLNQFKTEIQKSYPSLELLRCDEDIREIADQINRLETMTQEKLSVIPGTSFQKQVWRALLEIPKGQTKSYSDIASTINRPKSARAVANAIGANPVSVFIPCHRVIRSDGSLGGYRWGLATKTQLLSFEGVSLS